MSAPNAIASRAVTRAGGPRALARSAARVGALAGVLALAACGSGGDGACTIGESEGCDEGQICEAQTRGGETVGVCVFPTRLDGIIRDGETGAGIGGARVILLEADDQRPVATTTSAADGSYSFEISLVRSDGDDDEPRKDFLVYASSSGYYPFPSPVQQPIAVEVVRTDPEALEPAVTAWDVELLAAPPENQRQISGMVTGANAEPLGGVLVVLTDSANTELGTSTISAEDGTYVLHSVRQGQYTLTGYRAGLNFDVTSVQLGSQDQTVNISSTGEATGTVSGMINIVATDPRDTDVVLLIPSVRQVPPGLRVAVPAGTGEFTFTGVPPGVYDIIPSFQNDDLVLDPSNIGQAGDPPRIDTSSGPVEVGAFKLTDSVIITDGEGDLPAVPTFSWADYPSAAQYAVELRDIRGEVIWGGIEVQEGQLAPVPGDSNVQDGTSVTYSGDPLVPGRTYQWRVYAFKVAASTACRCELVSLSEDLRGVFRVTR